MLLLAAGPVWAADLSLPQGAFLTQEENRPYDSYDVPLGAWAEETGIPSRRVEGRIELEAWRIDGGAATTLQILAPLREQLQEAGHEILFECASAGCGGFDFRFETPVLPGPEMYVDLTDYRFLSAQDREGSYVTLLVSRSEAASYVQIVRAGKAARAATAAIVQTRTKPRTATVTEKPPTDGSITERLEANGFAILTDLEFASGAASLGDDAVASLDEIAAYLKANPRRDILFVGHTDATGSLQANIALSRRRAQAAADYLRQRHDIPRDQIGADGVGYLSPVTTNLTEAGREANRRVEAVLISTE
ncbi:OmpA family protein [Aestuariicoccus sp. MJ-SS9]|uniref:OmpA family protein n=1 Tax=Aestuariicoccus sp. MJ-SS9 TaxID=3079855 RepID=UPI00292DCF61|nr:OmpA family protein [Aestuariicoccus sp. MJ-SS9]